jgi:flagellar biosynthesis anti-sigma factor FlgM
MKISNDPIRAYEPTASRSSESAATSAPAKAPEDRVQISAEASALHEQTAAESKSKVEAMKRALSEGRNIVDHGRIAEGIIDDATGAL